MRRIAIFLFLIGFGVFSQTLDSLIEKQGKNLLGTSQRTLIQELGLKKLTWNTSNRSQIRFSQSISDENFTLCGEKIVEAVFDFSDKKLLSAITVSMYNRGDCGAWTKERFDTCVRIMERKLPLMLKQRQGEKSSRRLEDNTVNQLVWHPQGFDVALRWCGSKESTEYITINFAKRNEIQDLRQDMRTEVRTGELVNRVKKEVDGTRWFEVPMVNQGDKGYCVAAVMERLMKYYNSSVDQHIIAQIMSSDPSKGTDLIRGVEALKENDVKLRVRVKSVYKDGIFKGEDGLKDLFREYNRFAKKRKLDTLEESTFRQHGFNLVEIFGRMNSDIFYRVRSKRSPGVNNFMMKVKSSIDKGVPLVWTIVVMPNELPRQPQVSFHARIINGYNPKTAEIIYTDSWGYGYEKKTMPADRAWAITTMLLSVAPR